MNEEPRSSNADDMDGDDGDDTATNQKQKKKEEHEYDDEDENGRDYFDKDQDLLFDAVLNAIINAYL